MAQAANMIQEPGIARGLYNRVSREVFAAAIAPKSDERDERLAYWHVRQAAVELMVVRHGLFRPYHMLPLGKMTKAERADVRDLARTPRWRPCPNELAAGA